MIVSLGSVMNKNVKKAALTKERAPGDSSAPLNIEITFGRKLKGSSLVPLNSELILGRKLKGSVFSEIPQSSKTLTSVSGVH